MVRTLVELMGQTIALAPEQKPVIRLELEVGVGRAGMAAEGDQTPSALLACRLERIKIAVALKAHQRPVVQSGSAQLTVIDAEPERFNEVELAVGGGTGAGHIARVGGNLGLKQDDPGHGRWCWACQRPWRWALEMGLGDG
jgi:hypothetical protein